MGFRYRKSLKVGGVRLTAGKNGIGVSAGVKGLRVSHGADGKMRVTASIPGTGISYQETVGGKKKIEKKPKSQQYEVDESLCTFDGTIRVIREDGKMVFDEFNRHYYNGKFTVNFYLYTLHMIDPERGQLTLNASPGEIEIRKHTYVTGFWIFKGNRTDLIIDVNGTEYTFQMLAEAEADRVIDWHNDFKEKWKNDSNPEYENDYEVESSSAALDDEEPILFGSCTNCFTRDEIENWQLSIDEETLETSIYCKHCSEEYYWDESLDWESQFLNSEGEYAFSSMTCPNPSCEEQISLIGVPFEDGVAHVTCWNCDAEIDVTPPS